MITRMQWRTQEFSTGGAYRGFLKVTAQVNDIGPIAQITSESFGAQRTN